MHVLVGMFSIGVFLHVGYLLQYQKQGMKLTSSSGSSASMFPEDDEGSMRGLLEPPVASGTTLPVPFALS
jgi:hypothetical protein